MSRRQPFRLTMWLTAGAMVFLVAAPAQAAFPGLNGRVAFVGIAPDGSTDIYSAEPDNNDAVARLTEDGISDNPAFSPDGARLAFTSGTKIYVGDQYANDPQLVFDPGFEAFGIDWSPDGTQLVAALPNCAEFACEPDIYVFGTDGSGRTNLTETPYPEYHPAWFGTGTKIAFDSPGTGGESDIYTIHVDGTGLLNVTANFAGDAHEPDWIPPNLGAKIAFDSESSIYWVYSDGIGTTYLTFGRQPAWSPDGNRVASTAEVCCGQPSPAVRTTGPYGGFYARLGTGRDPDWQVRQPGPEPPPGSEFPRPKGASPLTVPLVMNYNECQSTNATRQHGPPLAYPSCAPARTGAPVTVGTPDVNGFAAEATGSVRFDSIVGNPTTPADEADVRIRVHQTDLRRNTSGYPDYNGSLVLFVPLRISDLWNAGGPEGSGTVIDYRLRLAVDCGETSGPEGGACSINTTIDAITPGLIRERKRTIWQPGQVLVHYAGGDEDPYSLADNRPLLAQGLFVP